MMNYGNENKKKNISWSSLMSYEKYTYILALTFIHHGRICCIALHLICDDYSKLIKNIINDLK